MEPPDPEELDPDSVRIAREGISKHSFCFGILLAVLVPFSFGRYPHHAWLVLLAGYVILAPLWYCNAVWRRHGHWFILELCWVTTFCIAGYFALIISQVLSEEQRLWGFRFVFMSSAGSLTCCALVLRHALVFYSIDHMASTFVQVVPLVTALAMRSWRGGFSSGLRTAWAGYFPESVWDQTHASDLLLAAFLPYLAWLALYAIWLLTVGVALHKKGCDTVFHEFYRWRLRRRCGETSTSDEIRSNVFLYLLTHVCLVSISFLWALLVWFNYSVHVAWTLVVVFYCAWAGSEHYIAVTIKKFGPLMKRLKAEEDREKFLAKQRQAAQEDAKTPSQPARPGSMSGLGRTGAVELIQSQDDAVGRSRGQPSRIRGS